MSLVRARTMQRHLATIWPASRTGHRVGMWSSPAVIAPNNFVYKSLSNWAFNVAVGCSHACRFCYVPSAATIKQGPKLAEYGVQDPNAEWGDYVLLRPWEEDKFLASLRTAENTPRSLLKPDGNRAVMYCSTKYPSLPRQGRLETLGKRRKESVEGKGPPGAERMGMSETMWAQAR